MQRFECDGFEGLLQGLKRRGFGIRGPTVSDGVIVIDEIESTSDFPAGWTDSQKGGEYRLVRRDDDAWFAFNVGPHSWKKFLYPPARRLWQAQRTNGAFEIIPEEVDPPMLAFVGVRACELAALDVQDRVLMNGKYVDSLYQAQRERLFIVAVNCAKAGGTCFCASMNTGPRARRGYDIALTEIVDGGAHYFLAEAGSDAGAEVLEELDARQATPVEAEEADRQAEATVRQMTKHLDTTDIKNLLYRNAEHPRWEQVAKRCLMCANCTMVCPTCFCHTVEDVTDITGDHSERWRRWDSCFTLDFSYIHGGPVRATPQARYRQWMTHKLASWIDQFGTSGCVGCGRCITWCPVGIDITEETAAIRETDPFRTGAQGAKETT